MRNLTVALMTTTMLGLSAQGALAVEPQEFMERFKVLFSQQGSAFEFGSIEGDTSSFTVKDLTMTAVDNNGAFSVPFNSITINNIDETSDGRYTADTLQVADIDINDNDRDVKVSGVSMSGLELPDPAKNGFVFYENFSVDSAEIGADGSNVFQMRGASIDLKADADRTNISGTITIPTIMTDLSKTSTQDSRKILADMGYLTLNGSMGMDMAWNADTGLMNINDYFIDFNDVGRLSINMTIDGYTLDLVKQLGQMAQNKDQQAAGMAMMGLMQQLNYIDASIKFEDKSLTNKILDFQAAKQGTDRATLVGMASAVIPFALAQLNKPEFTKQVSAAVATYLSDPKSFEITAKPSQPVPFMNLAATGSTQPQNLIDMLDVQVKANQ